MCYDMVMSNILDQQNIKQVFWDRAEMTPARLKTILNNPDSPEYYPVLGRMVERLSAEDISSIVDRNILFAQFPKLRIWSKISVQKAKELFGDKYVD